MLDRELSLDFNRRRPVLPHVTIAGVKCSGAIVETVEGGNVELQCSECGAVVGVMQVGVLRALLRIDCAKSTCRHCGREHIFPGMTVVRPYVCHACGKTVQPEGAGSDLDPGKWVIRTMRASSPPAP